MSLLNNVEIKNKTKKGVVVRGTGIHAARCSYIFWGLGIEIAYYITTSRKTELFRNKPVYGLKEISYNDDYVVVATSLESYCMIADEFRKEGRREFIDFAYYEWFIKDIVLLHGNCHMDILKTYLLSSVVFNDMYAVYPYPLLISSTKEFRIEPEIFKNINVWIHEDIRDNNSFQFEVSDTYIKQYVSKSVVEIRIPHLYGIGKMFFPQSIVLPDGRNEPINDGRDTDGVFRAGDVVIESCIAKGMKIEQIVEYCQSDSAIATDDILENFNDCLKKLKDREQSWDIKIYDFIMKRYKFEKLFFDAGHPTNVIMKYIAMNVLGLLGIDDTDIFCIKNMDAHENCVYPCVKKVLGLEWNESEVRKNGKRLSCHMDFAEYIKEYCYWRYYDIFSSLI